MSKNIIKPVFNLAKNSLINTNRPIIIKLEFIQKRLLSVEKNDDDKSVEKISERKKKPKAQEAISFKFVQKYVKKFSGDEDEQESGEERKGPFKNYYEDDERSKKSIMFYEDFFDKNAKEKNRDNFMMAIEAFKITNPTKQFYIDFIYGALLKMKEYDAHTSLEAYRKLMEIFPVGPLRCVTKWQIDNFHYPRQQNCALAILEQMERNGVIPDEDLGRLAINIFGDWTHVVRKIKRQLYWLPKFKNANPYPIPSMDKFEKMSKLDLAVAALKRMCETADNATKITINYSNELGSESSADEESTWIVTAQSETQIELLSKHKKDVPIYVEGPHYTWLKSQMVEYFVMKTDPLPETLEKIKILENINLDDLTNMPNAFDDPFKKTAVMKTPNLSVHEMAEGIYYAVCCTRTLSKNSLYNWTKLLEKKIDCLKNFVIVYKLKDKSTTLVDPSKLKHDDDKNHEKNKEGNKI